MTTDTKYVAQPATDSAAAAVTPRVAPSSLTGAKRSREFECAKEVAIHALATVVANTNIRNADNYEDYERHMSDLEPCFENGKFVGLPSDDHARVLFLMAQIAYPIQFFDSEQRGAAAEWYVQFSKEFEDVSFRRKCVALMIPSARVNDHKDDVDAKSVGTERAHEDDDGVPLAQPSPAKKKKTDSAAGDGKSSSNNHDASSAASTTTETLQGRRSPNAVSMVRHGPFIAAGSIVASASASASASGASRHEQAKISLKLSKQKLLMASTMAEHRLLAANTVLSQTISRAVTEACSAIRAATTDASVAMDNAAAASLLLNLNVPPNAPKALQPVREQRQLQRSASTTSSVTSISSPQSPPVLISKSAKLPPFVSVRPRPLVHSSLALDVIRRPTVILHNDQVSDDDEDDEDTGDGDADATKDNDAENASLQTLRLVKASSINSAASLSLLTLAHDRDKKLFGVNPA